MNKSIGRGLQRLWFFIVCIVSVSGRDWLGNGLRLFTFSGLRLKSVSNFYFTSSQGLRRKARRCNGASQWVRVAFKSPVRFFWCICLGLRLIGTIDLLLHLFRGAFGVCQHLPLHASPGVAAKSLAVGWCFWWILNFLNVLTISDDFDDFGDSLMIFDGFWWCLMCFLWLSYVSVDVFWAMFWWVLMSCDGCLMVFWWI